MFLALALEKEKDKEASKRHTMSHPPDRIPDLDSPRQSRSPLKKDKKEKVCLFFDFFLTNILHFFFFLTKPKEKELKNLLTNFFLLSPHLLSFWRPLTTFN